jgi:hypothetical protein
VAAVTTATICSSIAPTVSTTSTMLVCAVCATWSASRLLP